MFDDSGNYSGNWKQMSNVGTYNYNKQFDSSKYSSDSWYANNQKMRALNYKNSYSNKSYIETSTTPFRYNSLDYTRSRQVAGGHGESYSARCHDIGDASFCR